MLLWIIAATAAVGAATTTAVLLSDGTPPRPIPACTVASSATKTTYSLSPDQAQNAAIIAAVAFQKGLPDHSVTVALAAALQESQLVNLPYGDRDSVGLFQQRPSEGWGTKAQLLDPIYATTAFYGALTNVAGWQSMAVTAAAQAVQRSAAPSAYAVWADEARVLAIALTGETPAGLTCHFTTFGGAAPAASVLGQAMASEMGQNLIGSTLSTKTGWIVASWVVAHAYAYHVTRVAFAGWLWRSSSGAWTPVSHSPVTNVVSVATT